MIIGCGNATYGDKASCETNFTAAQAKVDTLREMTSTKSELIATLGEPEQIYRTNTENIKDYAYRVYAYGSVGYCGQYRVAVDETNSQMQGIKTYKDYLYR